MRRERSFLGNRRGLVEGSEEEGGVLGVGGEASGGDGCLAGIKPSLILAEKRV